jgi:hypothetical protein
MKFVLKFVVFYLEHWCILFWTVMDVGGILLPFMIVRNSEYVNEILSYELFKCVWTSHINTMHNWS